MKRKLLVSWLFALCVCGAWVCGQLVKRHADVWGSSASGTGLFAQVCEASKDVGMGCSEAANGPWSQIEFIWPLPTLDFSWTSQPVIVPVAFLGLAYFVFFGVWFTFMEAHREASRGVHSVSVVMCWCGLLVSMFYIALMAFQFETPCIWCGIVHVINILMVFSARRLYPSIDRTSPTTTKTASRPVVNLQANSYSSARDARRAIAVSLMIIVGLWAYRSERIEVQRQINKLIPYKNVVTALQNDPEFLLSAFRAQPRHMIEPRTAETVSQEHAQLVVFTDFECPACYCNQEKIHNQIAKAFGSRLDVLVRHYPLSNMCNDHVESNAHANACPAAYAVEAARSLGGPSAMGRMHDLLFRHRNKLSDDLYRKLAAEIGLDPLQFDRAMADEQVRSVVADDIKLARSLGVRGTPAIFLNGRRVTSLMDSGDFWVTIADNWRELNSDEALVAQAIPLAP